MRCKYQNFPVNNDGFRSLSFDVLRPVSGMQCYWMLCTYGKSSPGATPTLSTGLDTSLVMTEVPTRQNFNLLAQELFFFNFSTLCI